MPKFIIKKDQAGVLGHKIIDLRTGEQPIDVLMRYIESIDIKACQIFINDRPVDLNELYPKELLLPLGPNDNLTYINEAKAEVAIIAGVALIAALVATSLTPEPEIPNRAGQQKSSPNNQLNGQRNKMRPYQEWPLVMGSPKLIPDLIGEPLYEYINGIKTVEQYFIACFGKIQIDEIRTGESPLESVGNGSSRIYQPFENVPLYRTAFEIDGVENQPLKAPNDQSDSDSNNTRRYTSSVIEGTATSTTLSVKIDKNAEADDLFDLFTQQGNTSTDIIYFAGDDINNLTEVNASGTITSMTLEGNAYRVFVSNAQDLDGDPFPRGITFIAQVGTGGSFIRDVNTPVATDEVWINCKLKGLRRLDVDGNSVDQSVVIKVRVKKLDKKNGNATGFEFEKIFTITENTLEGFGRSLKLEKDDLNGRGFYRLTIERTSNSELDNNQPDECVAESVQCVNYYDNKVFGECTILKVTIDASDSGSRDRETKINISGTAFAPGYNFSTGQYIDPRPSRKFQDCVLKLLSYYNLPLDTIDPDELYSSDIEADFDFTFDDDEVDFFTRLETILNIAQGFCFDENNKIRVKYIGLEQSPVSLIARTDIAKERDFSQGFKTYNEGVKDGIRLEYVDRSTNKKTYIHMRVNEFGDVVNGIGRNPKKVELAGCQDVVLAKSRCYYECANLVFKRETVSDTLLLSQSMIERGDVIQYAEQFDSETHDGEILAVNGDIATTSEAILWEYGKEYVVSYTLPSGSRTQEFDVYATTECKEFRCSGLSQVFTRDSELGFETQKGSRYLIKEKSTRKEQWRVVDRELKNNLIQIGLENYTDQQFLYDINDSDLASNKIKVLTSNQSLNVAFNEQVTLKANAINYTELKWFLIIDGNSVNLDYGGSELDYTAQQFGSDNTAIIRCVFYSDDDTQFVDFNLTQVVKPVITHQPLSVTTESGKSVTLVSDGQNFDSIQWYKLRKNGWADPIGGATEKNITFTATDGDIFFAEYKKGDYVTRTNKVMISAMLAPTITQQPQDLVITDETQSIVLKSNAINYMTVQWYRVLDGVAIPFVGGNSPTLTIDYMTTGQFFANYCVINDGVCICTRTDIATVTTSGQLTVDLAFGDNPAIIGGNDAIFGNKIIFNV